MASIQLQDRPASFLIGRMPTDGLEPQITLTMPITAERDHLLGPAEAKITLLEYGDYECPTCEIAYPIVKQVLKEMGSGRAVCVSEFSSLIGASPCGGCRSGGRSGGGAAQILADA